MKKARITLLLALLLFAHQAQTQTPKTSKKTFKLNLTGWLTSLDPAFADQRTNIWAVTQLYNGLFSFSEDLHVHPQLAYMYEISEDGLTYTFTIKDKVFFHDDPAFANGQGREVTSDDFVYSFKRLMNPRTASRGSWIFIDKIKRDNDGKIADDWVAKIDKYKFKITLARRFPAFLQILAMPFTFVVAKEVVEKYGKAFRRHPVGTGPFKLKTWNENEKLILVKNPKYWKRDIKYRQLPYLDAVQVSFVQDKNLVFRNFEQKKLDFLTNVPARQRPKILNKDGSIKKDFKSKFAVEKKPFLMTEYVGFLLDGTNEKVNPLLNLKVRKALSYAIDRKSLIASTRNGLGTPGNLGFVPDAIASYDSARIRGYKFNVKKAQQLLREAGYPQGKGFPEITLNTYNGDQKIVAFLQKQWKQHLGIQVKTVNQPFVTHRNAVNNGKVNVFRSAWIADYPDADNFLTLFYSKYVAPDGPYKTRFEDTAFDQLFIEARKTDNTFTRFSNYHKMDQIIVDQAPVIVLYYEEVLNLTQKNITGAKTNTMNTLSLEKVDFKN